MIRCTVLACVAIAMVTGQGFSDDNDETWSYEWYNEESFTFYCNSSALAVTELDYIVWETPGKLTLQNGVETDDYKVNDKNGVRDMELHIKLLRPETHGVYICRIYNSNNATLRRQALFAINMKNHKYRKTFDKYETNLVTAIVSSVVFLVPLVGSGLIYQFRYRTPEERIRKQERKSGRQKYSYDISGSGGTEMQQTYPDGLAEKVQGEEGRGAYVNPGVSTQF